MASQSERIPVLKPDNVRNICNQTYNSEDDEEVEMDVMDMTIEDECRVKKQITEDFKGIQASLTTLRVNDQATEKAQALFDVIDTVNEKTNNLQMAMSSKFFTQETSILEQCAEAAKETLYSLDGVAVALDPIRTADKIKKSLDEFIKQREEQKENEKEERIDNKRPNPLLIDSDEDNDGDVTDSDEDDEVSDDDDDNSNGPPKKRRLVGFGGNLAYLDVAQGVLFEKIRRRCRLFADENSKKLLRQTMMPALAENTDGVEFLLPLVDVKNVEKEKKIVIKKPREEKKKEKGELVKLTGNAQEKTEQDHEDIIIADELDHVQRCMKRTMKKEGIIDYYKFILDPHSYSKTVLNMFHVSYLMRDEKVYMAVNDDGLFLRLIPKDVTKDQLHTIKSEHRFQGVVSFNYKNWNDLKDLYKLQTANITPK